MQTFHLPQQQTILTFPDGLLDALRTAHHIAVFTGAGVSAESGIPTFRDALTGLWEQYDASLLASEQGFRNDPALVWGWYEWRRMKVLQASPNPAHRAIAQLARQVPRLTVITQNVDDLHERAGSQSVLHLHGSIHQPRCFACAHPWHYPAGIPDEPEGGRRVDPPRCSRCKTGRIRPGVVWFGESLPGDVWSAAQQAVEECDVLFSIGTSSLVWPAARLPQVAKQRGATVIQINPNATSLDEVASFNLYGPAGEVLPALVDQIKQENRHADAD